MPCIPLIEKRRDGRKYRIGFLCTSNVYHFPHGGSWYWLEWHSYLGPIAVRNDTWEPRIRVQAGWWDAAQAFAELTAEERKQFLHEE